MRRRIDWRIPAAAVVAALLVWLVTGIILAGRNEVALPNAGSIPITLKGGRVTANRISTKSWSFEYGKAQMTPDGTMATVTGVRRGILYKKGKPYLSIAANQVSANTQTLDFTAIGNVHIAQLNPKDAVPRSFDTNLVQWTNVTKTLTLSHPSTIRTGDHVLKVASVTVNFNTGDIRFGRLNGALQAP